MISKIIFQLATLCALAVVLAQAKPAPAKEPIPEKKSDDLSSAETLWPIFGHGYGSSNYGNYGGYGGYGGRGYSGWGTGYSNSYNPYYYPSPYYPSYGSHGSYYNRPTYENYAIHGGHGFGKYGNY